MLTKEEATVCFRELDLFVTEKLHEDHGYSYLLTSCQKPQLIKDGRRIKCNTANYVPIVVLGLSTSSSSSSLPTSPTSASQESVTRTEHPASTRSENMSEEVQGNLSHGPAETENPHKNDDDVDVQGNLSHDLPEWLEEFKGNLVDESVPEHRDASSSSHELPSEPRAKVVSVKHCIFTHFPKDRNCDICVRAQITSSSCRTGTGIVESGQFRDLITADQRVLSEGCEFRNNYRYAADKIWQLSGYNPTHVKQKLLRKRRRSCKSSWSRRGNQKTLTPRIPQNLANLVKTFPGIIVRQHLTDRKLMGLLREQCAESRKGHLRYCCNQVWGKKKVGGFHGMLLLFAKHTRSLVWWDDTWGEAIRRTM